MLWGKNVSSLTPLAFGIRHIIFTWLPARQSVPFSNRSNIVAGLPIGRDVTTILEHRAFSGSITREHQIYFPIEHFHQLTEELLSPPDVLTPVERSPGAHRPCG